MRIRRVTAHDSAQTIQLSICPVTILEVLLHMKNNIALLFAGGVGSRMHGAKTPKQFLKLGGKAIIAHTIDHFERHPLIDYIIVACVRSGIPTLNQIIKEERYEKIISVVPGGSTGQESIFNGLNEIERKQLANDNTVILVHDGVRPLIDEKTITSCIESVRTRGCTTTVAPAIETIIEEHNGQVDRIVDRSYCKLARAPQGFFFKDLYNNHKQAIADNNLDFIDSISLMSHYGYDIHTIEGPTDNIKITTRRDFFSFKGYMDYKEMEQLWEN